LRHPLRLCRFRAAAAAAAAVLLVVAVAVADGEVLSKAICCDILQNFGGQHGSHLYSHKALGSLPSIKGAQLLHIHTPYVSWTCCCCWRCWCPGCCASYSCGGRRCLATSCCCCCCC
jgi:hypothetical protein